MSIVYTLRGSGGEVVYLEEAAFMDIEVIFQVVLPMLPVKGTALIAISSPLGANNHLTALTKIKSGDEPFFNYIPIVIECKVCEALVRKGNGRRIKKCRHVTLPHWKDVDMQELVGHVYKELGREREGERENEGRITDDQSSAFMQPWITNLEVRSSYISQSNIEWILTTCDPNGGSKNSDTALLSAYYQNGRMVICGLDFHGTQRTQKPTLLRAHIEMLRLNPRFKDARIVFVPENNMKEECMALVSEAVKLPGVVIWVDEDGSEGATTRQGTKARYTDVASRYLSLDNVVFDAEAICANPWQDPRERMIKAKTALLSQLGDWRFLPSKSKNPRKIIPGTYSGKTNELGVIVPGKKDDATVAFIMNAYFAHLVAENREVLFSER